MNVQPSNRGSVWSAASLRRFAFSESQSGEDSPHSIRCRDNVNGTEKERSTEHANGNRCNSRKERVENYLSCLSKELDHADYFLGNSRIL
jgi:hypothetical protein